MFAEVLRHAVLNTYVIFFAGIAGQLAVLSPDSSVWSYECYIETGIDGTLPVLTLQLRSRCNCAMCTPELGGDRTCLRPLICGLITSVSLHRI